MTAASHGGRRRRSPRELTDRHRRALVFLLARERDGDLGVATEHELEGAIGRYATNTITSLLERGFTSLTAAEYCLTPLGRTVAGEIVAHSAAITRMMVAR